MNASTQLQMKSLQQAGVPSLVWRDTRSMATHGVEHVVETLEEMSKAEGKAYYIHAGSSIEWTNAAAAISKGLMLKHKTRLRFAFTALLGSALHMFEGGAYIDHQMEAFSLAARQNYGPSSFLVLPDLLSARWPEDRQRSSLVEAFILRHLYDGGNVITGMNTSAIRAVELAQLPPTLSEVIGSNLSVITKS